MENKELIQFLKDNLRVEVNVGNFTLEVSLYLGNEKISSSTDELP